MMKICHQMRHFGVEDKNDKARKRERKDEVKKR